MKNLRLVGFLYISVLPLMAEGQPITEFQENPTTDDCRKAAQAVRIDRELDQQWKANERVGALSDQQRLNVRQKEACEQWQFRLLDPKVRIYFDAGRDGDNRIDLFRDGSLAAAVDLAAFVKPFKFTQKGWSTNFVLGIGIGGQGTTSTDGMSVASSAPIVLASAGFLLEVPLNRNESGEAQDNNYVGIEIGRSYGITSDENFNGSAAEDHAWYVGVTLKVPPK